MIFDYEEIKAKAPKGQPTDGSPQRPAPDSMKEEVSTHRPPRTSIQQTSRLSQTPASPRDPGRFSRMKLSGVTGNLAFGYRTQGPFFKPPTTAYTTQPTAEAKRGSDQISSLTQAREQTEYKTLDDRVSDLMASVTSYFGKRHSCKPPVAQLHLEPVQALDKLRLKYQKIEKLNQLSPLTKDCPL